VTTQSRRREEPRRHLQDQEQRPGTRPARP
jgi:hypothetical protein